MKVKSLLPNTEMYLQETPGIVGLEKERYRQDSWEGLYSSYLYNQAYTNYASANMVNGNSFYSWSYWRIHCQKVFDDGKAKQSMLISYNKGVLRSKYDVVSKW